MAFGSTSDPSPRWRRELVYKTPLLAGRDDSTITGLLIQTGKTAQATSTTCIVCCIIPENPMGIVSRKTRSSAQPAPSCIARDVDILGFTKYPKEPNRTHILGM